MDDRTLVEILSKAAERVNEYSTQICEVRGEGYTPFSPAGHGLAYFSVEISTVSTLVPLGMAVGEVIAEMAAETYAGTGVELSDLISQAMTALAYPEIATRGSYLIVYWVRVPHVG